MDCKLINKVHKGKTKEGKEFTANNFYLRFANGVELKILPNKYEDDKGVNHSNESKLVLVADNDLPF